MNVVKLFRKRGELAMSHLLSKHDHLDHPNGSVSGIDSFAALGVNPNTVAAGEDVWVGSGPYVAPAAASVHEVVSTDANDAAGGTGARSIVIAGLDSDFFQASEVVPTDGLTPSPSTTLFARINETKVGAWGSTGLNIGGIITESVASSTVSAQIVPGAGVSQQAVYTVPRGKVGHITSVHASLNKSAGGPPAEVLIEWLVRENADDPASGWVSRWQMGVVHGGTSVVTHAFSPAARVVGPADIRMCVTDITGGPLNIGASFAGMLIDDDD